MEHQYIYILWSGVPWFPCSSDRGRLRLAPSDGRGSPASSDVRPSPEVNTRLPSFFVDLVTSLIDRGFTAREAWLLA